MAAQASFSAASLAPSGGAQAVDRALALLAGAMGRLLPFGSLATWTRP